MSLMPMRAQHSLERLDICSSGYGETCAGVPKIMSRQSGKSIVNRLGTPHCAEKYPKSSASEGCRSGAETGVVETYPLSPTPVPRI